MSDISYTEIHNIIDLFYVKAKKDILIGFQFNVIDDFDKHISHISQFWEFQLTGQITKKLEHPFNMPIHQQLNLTLGQLNRWIVLFFETLDEQLTDQDLILEWKEKVNVFKNIFIRNFLVS
jgi:truncated hemoglobin YjbI